MTVHERNDASGRTLIDPHDPGRHLWDRLDDGRDGLDAAAPAQFVCAGAITR